MNLQLFNQDCLEVLKKLPENSIDSVVTDPPYGLGKEPDVVEVMSSWIKEGFHEVKGTGFMGKEWDSFVPQPIVWKEVLRVLKPGGHILCFSATRTVDWMGLSLRFAGFEIRDMIAWVYGSGFPKSLNIGKAIDEIQGNEREEYYENPYLDNSIRKYTKPSKEFDKNKKTPLVNGLFKKSKGNTEYEGWGTGLKPALEPIILARKPISENSIAENVLRWGTGGINIDDCRIELQESGEDKRLGGKGSWSTKGAGWVISTPEEERLDVTSSKQGRFPANFIHDGSDEVIQNFPYTKPAWGNKVSFSNTKSWKQSSKVRISDNSLYRDEGSASRFFYCAKPSQSERTMGLENFDFVRHSDRNKEDGVEGDNPRNRSNNLKQNFHPTVKPINLISYLCKLITPKNGIVLDPFMGSGTTGIACKFEGFGFTGIELESDYFKLAESRIKNSIKEDDYDFLF